MNGNVLCNIFRRIFLYIFVPEGFCNRTICVGLNTVIAYVYMKVFFFFSKQHQELLRHRHKQR